MKKIISIFFILAAGACLQTSCIEDEYDLTKDIDETIELKNFTIAIDKSYKTEARDFLLPDWLDWLPNFMTSWVSHTFEFDGGEIGTFDIDGIADELTLEYGCNKLIATMDVKNTLPCGFTITANALDQNKNVDENIVATCEPVLIPSGELKGAKVEVVSRNGSEIHIDAIRLTLHSEQETVTINANDYIEVSNIVLSFPNGIVKKDID